MDDEFDGYNGTDLFKDKYQEVDDEDREDMDEGENVDQYRGDSTVPTFNPKSVRERIDETLEVLANLKNRKDIRLSRSELLVTLSKDLSEYYGYLPELADFLLDLFSPAECVEYMDASDRPRPLVIRTNTLKTTRKDLMEALTKRGATVEVVDWSKVAIKITESAVPIGATPEYLGGHYMLQSAASMNPVLALSPMPNERILDMAAAPGGKTSYIAQLMKNSGLIIANDLKPQRQKATVANLHRLGVKNSIVCCYDGRKIPKIMKGFDRVLLDAPCSGLGVISRDPSVKIQRTMKDIQRISHLQKELILAAVDAVDCKSSTGGVIVYSTCSIAVEENEQVVDYVLSKRYVRLVDTGLTVGKPGFTRYQQRRFNSTLSLTRRFYPHVHNMDGFFVAKFIKYENGPRESNENDEDDDEEHEELNEDGEMTDGDLGDTFDVDEDIQLTGEQYMKGIVKQRGAKDLSATTTPTKEDKEEVLGAKSNKKRAKAEASDDTPTPVADKKKVKTIEKDIQESKSKKEQKESAKSAEVTKVPEPVVVPEPPAAMNAKSKDAKPKSKANSTAVAAPVASVPVETSVSKVVNEKDKKTTKKIEEAVVKNTKQHEEQVEEQQQQQQQHKKEVFGITGKRLTIKELRKLALRKE